MNKTITAYDTAIIGAGPAGSSLAYFLAASGFKVILIDKERFPRKKVCAGGLPSKILKVLPFDISPVIEKDISEVSLTYKLRESFQKSYQETLIYTVEREKFDNFLTEKAKVSGAIFLDGQKIDDLHYQDGYWFFITNGEKIKARVLVGADGANSFVAKTIGLKPADFFGLGIQVEVPTSISRKYITQDDKTIILDWGSIKDGYGWLFPKKETVSIGVKGPVILGKQLRLYLFDMLEYLGLKAENLAITAHLIPYRVSKKSISTKGAILIGDAAGLVDYWTGEGIFYAIKSSTLAAEEIRKFLKGNIGSLRHYEAAVNREIMPELQTSYHFAKMFNYLSSIAFKAIRKYDYPWNAFCRIMRGDRTFLEAQKRLRPDILFKKLIFKNQRGK